MIDEVLNCLDVLADKVEESINKVLDCNKKYEKRIDKLAKKISDIEERLRNRK